MEANGPINGGKRPQIRGSDSSDGGAHSDSPFSPFLNQVSPFRYSVVVYELQRQIQFPTARRMQSATWYLIKVLVVLYLSKGEGVLSSYLLPIDILTLTVLYFVFADRGTQRPHKSIPTPTPTAQLPSTLESTPSFGADGSNPSPRSGTPRI